jgi:hypothetical protein
MDTFNEVIMKQGGISNTNFKGKNIGIVQKPFIIYFLQKANT